MVHRQRSEGPAAASTAASNLSGSTHRTAEAPLTKAASSEAGMASSLSCRRSVVLGCEEMRLKRGGGSRRVTATIRCIAGIR